MYKQLVWVRLNSPAPPPTLRRPPHLMHMHIVSARCKCMSGQYRVARHCLFPGSPPPPPPSAYWHRSVMRKQKDSLGFHFFLSLFAEINAASPAPPQLAPPKSKPGVLGPAASLGSLLTAVADRGFRKSCLSMLTYSSHTTHNWSQALGLCSHACATRSNWCTFGASKYCVMKGDEHKGWVVCHSNGKAVCLLSWGRKRRGDSTS